MRQPDVIKLSASAVRSFQECPYRYARDYVDRLPNQQRQPVSILAVGNAVHQVLARFVREGGRAACSRDDLASLLMDSWDSKPFASPEVELDQFQRAKDMVERFYDAPYPSDGPSDLAQEQYLRWRNPHRGILATGRVDRLCQLGDGTLEVIDFKTGKTPLTARELANEFQAVFYRSLVAEAYQAVAQAGVRVTFHYLATGTNVSVDFEREDFLALWDEIEAIADDIREATIAAQGGSLVEAFPRKCGHQCRFCPMRGHCEEASALSPEGEGAAPCS